MINPSWLELPLSQTNFHGPKGVRAIEDRLYLESDISTHCWHAKNVGGYKNFVSPAVCLSVSLFINLSIKVLNLIFKHSTYLGKGIG